MFCNHEWLTQFIYIYKSIYTCGFEGDEKLTWIVSNLTDFHSFIKGNIDHTNTELRWNNYWCIIGEQTNAFCR